MDKTRFGEDVPLLPKRQVPLCAVGGGLKQSHGAEPPVFEDLI